MIDRVLLQYLRVREGFNVRAVLPNIPALAEDIAARGLLEPLTVIERPRERSAIDQSSWFEIVSGHRRHAALLLLVKQSRFSAYEPVPIRVVKMTIGEALLANLAENAHKEGMRQVDVYARCKQLLSDGATMEDVSRAVATSPTTLEKRMSTFRRLAPEIVARWREIERPEHEPPWHFLEDVARGTTAPGKRGGTNNVTGILPPVPTAAQLAVWRKFFGEVGGQPVKLAAPEWRERSHLRKTTEVKKAEKELRARAEIEITRASTLLAAADALAWVLGKREAP